MANKSDLQTRTESKARLVEQINTYLQTGEYSRALELARGAAAEFPNDQEMSGLEKLAHDGVKRKAETDRLVTESQELFAGGKPAEAIQVLRKAHEQDKNNSLTRAILANALVEHAHSLVETDWWEATKLAKQALELNPAHPTAKTIRSAIQGRKEASSIEEWISQVQKVQSSGDLLGALSLIAEGLDVHSRDPKLLLLQDAVQRDNDARRRQSRRGDLEDLRRMESEIAGAKDDAAKKALAERIQALAAKYWTDGAVLTVANHLLQRLGMAPQASSNASPKGKGQRAPVIFHVPRPTATEPPRTAQSPAAPSPTPPARVPTAAVAPSKVPPSQVPSAKAAAASAPGKALTVTDSLARLSPLDTAHVVTSPAPPGHVPPKDVPAATVSPNKLSPGRAPFRVAPRSRVRTIPTEPQVPALEETKILAAEASAPPVKVISPSSERRQPKKSSSTVLVLISSSAAAIILVAAIVVFARKDHAPSAATTSAPSIPAPVESAPAVSAPAASAPSVSAPSPTPIEPVPSPNASSGTVTNAEQPPPESAAKRGTLVIVAGQDDVKILLNGKLQPQLTRAGQLRLPNLESRDYVVQVSKSGFQDPPVQKVRIRKGEEARLVFNLQPQPRLASLTIQGGTAGTAVFVDQNPAGTIRSDGTLSVDSIAPGDHSIELRKERFKVRQFKKHFVAGGAILLGAADTALEAAPAELKITFTPADARVAIVKGDLLKMVSSGVPLNLAPGTYTLTVRTADGYTSSSALEVVAGQSRSLDFSFAPNGMSKWENPGAWKRDKDSFICKGGNFVLYGVVPTSGTFAFSAMPAKGHILQWVLNYGDSRNYLLFQMDDNNFYRTVIRNGQKTDQVIVPHKVDKKSLRSFHIRVSAMEIVHQIREGDRWVVLDRWTQPGANLGSGKFGFYIPGNDEVALTGFTHYADLSVR